MGLLEEPATYRLYHCQRCGMQVCICAQCDCGNVCCPGECAEFARRESLRRAGARYQRPEIFVEMFQRAKENNFQAAYSSWLEIESTVRLLFKEPNPMPIKHWLWRRGLIESPECRLPMTTVSVDLAKELDTL